MPEHPTKLPRPWQLATLGAVTAEKVLQAGPGDAEQFVYIDIGSVDNQTKKILDPKTLAAKQAPSRAKQNVKAGDVLVSMTRPNLNAVGIVTPELDGAVASTGFHVLRGTDAEPSWLFYAVQSHSFVDSMCRVVQGALYPAVRPKDIRAFPLPLPPLGDQRRIVAEIEKQFTRLDAAVSALKAVNANLKRYRAAVLQAAAEGRLVTTEAELSRISGLTYESADQLLQLIGTQNREADPKRERVDSYSGTAHGLTKLPEGWTWSRLAQLSAPEVNSITDGPFGSNLKTEHYTDEGPRVIRLQNIGDGIFIELAAHISQQHFLRLQRHRVFAGDLVIAAFGADPPRACVIPETVGAAIVKADCIRFKPHERVDGSYLNVALNSPTVRRQTKAQVHGVGRPRLNLREIKSILIPVPPPAEQKRIVAEVERRLSVVEELVTVVEASLRRAKRLRQSILQRAFSGNL